MVITLQLTVAGDVASFNQANFKINLAHQMTGVSPDDIELTVTPASVSVIATIRPQNVTVANAAQDDLQKLVAKGPSILSTALGTTVEKASVLKVDALAAPPSGPSAPIIAAIVAGVVVGIVALIAIFFSRRVRDVRRRSQSLTQQYLSEKTLYPEALMDTAVSNQGFRGGGGYSAYNKGFTSLADKGGYDGGLETYAPSKNLMASGI